MWAISWQLSNLNPVFKISVSDLAHPTINFSLNFFFGIAIMCLQAAFEFIAPALDYCKVVIGQFSPMLLGFALELFPIAFNFIPVHCILQYCVLGLAELRGLLRERSMGDLVPQFHFLWLTIKEQRLTDHRLDHFGKEWLRDQKRGFWLFTREEPFWKCRYENDRHRKAR